MEVENLARYQTLISIILKLQLYGAIKVQHREDEDNPQRLLVITAQRDPESPHSSRNLEDAQPRSGAQRLPHHRLAHGTRRGRDHDTNALRPVDDELSREGGGDSA